jgi:dipeptidyl aminopeptidase/acylaminoacyl peptidase
VTSASSTALTEMDSYVALPRVAGLWLSPDGRRLVVGVATLNAKKTKYTNALWQVDPTGATPARRLTRADEGESGAAFTPDGDLLFVSHRPEPGHTEDDDTTALWVQPAGGGDARVLLRLAGGARGLTVARDAGTVLFGSALLPSAADRDEDAELRKARKDAAVTAILHERYPVRYWDHDIGPAGTRLFAAGAPAAEAALEPRDLTGDVGHALENHSHWDITPDGATVVTAWQRPGAGGEQQPVLIAVDVATGTHRVLAESPDHEFHSPRISPDGATVAFVTEQVTTPERPGDVWLALVPVAGGEIRDLTADWDRWPGGARWTPDGSALVVPADDNGHGPLWRVDVATGEPTRITPDHGSYHDVSISPDGEWVYALRSAYDAAPAPVRVPLAGGAHQPLPGPAEALDQVAAIPGRLTEITATADDGVPVRAWLALPADAGDNPAPLLLWAHGGPLSSWNAWSWRWNPWPFVARGYAVLLPDPALSTGYGLEFVRRGWGSWGERPFTDLMTVVDAAVARPDIDAERTGAMGGSFGGYMANWIAGHTDRFDAIVTHASLWALDQFGPTTDAAYYWNRELSAGMAEKNSPHLSVDNITTPMLVIHGDQDYRVPIGEALRLWWDLASRHATAEDPGPHRFLYFPDENHWVLTPNHAKIWYSTVLAFLDQHILGKPWERPNLLG